MKRGDRVYCKRYHVNSRRVGTVRDLDSKTMKILWDNGECARYERGAFPVFLVDWGEDTTSLRTFI